MSVVYMRLLNMGKIDIVNWLIEVLQFKLSEDECLAAALHNQPEIYEMLVNQYKVEPKNLLPELSDLKPEMIMLFVQKFKFKPCQHNIDYAVVCDHVPAVKLLMEKHNLEPSEYSIDLALFNDNFDVLVYLWSTHKLKPMQFNVNTKNLIHLKWYLKEYDLKPTQALVNANPHLELLEFFYSEHALLPTGTEINCNELTFESAHWLEQHGVELNWTRLLRSLRLKGHLKGYKHFFDRECETTNLLGFIMARLMVNNYFHIIEFLREKLGHVYILRALSATSDMVDSNE